MSWRNHYRSERGKFASGITWSTPEEAQARAAHLLDQLSGERTPWAQSIKYLGAEAEKRKVAA